MVISTHSIIPKNRIRGYTLIKLGTHPKNDIPTGVAIFSKYGIHRKMKIEIISKRYAIFPFFIFIY